MPYSNGIINTLVDAQANIICEFIKKDGEQLRCSNCNSTLFNKGYKLKKEFFVLI